MKRDRYSIEGDPIGSTCFPNKPRYMGLDETPLPDSLVETRFAMLPIEVTHLIMRYTALGDPRDYQSFLRYILPVYGVLLTTHQRIYDQTLTNLLSEAQNSFMRHHPSLFQSSVRERLGRINSTISLHDTTSSPNDQVRSVKAISNATFIELFAFVNCRICECC